MYPLKRQILQAAQIAARWSLHLSLVSLLFSLSPDVRAMSLREFHTLEKVSREGIHYADYYLVGVMEGAMESHAQGVRNGAAPTICLNGRRLEPRSARGLFEAELRRNPGLYEADMPVQLVLTNALLVVYSCAD